MNELTKRDLRKAFVDRFLAWKLPTTMRPDNGITFDPIVNRGNQFESKREPTGTNLFDCNEAGQLFDEVVAPVLREIADALDSGLPSTTGSFSAEERGIVREKISPAPASQQDEAEMREAIAREYGAREGADECFECGGELSVVCLACNAPPPQVSDQLDRAVTPACEDCKHWCSSVKARDDDQDITGQCRALPPKADFRDGTAVWPFTEDNDWCGSFTPSADALERSARSSAGEG